MSDKGDHENFHARKKLNLTEYVMNLGDVSLLNAACRSVAVRIRPISEQRYWPNIDNTLLFFKPIRKKFS